MSRKSLVAVDGSPEAERALLWILEEMRPDQSVHAVYVISPSKYAMIEGAAGYEGIQTIHEMRERIIADEKEQAIERIKTLSQDRGIPVEMHVRVGDPRSEILNCAGEIGADLIAVGSTGKGLGTRLLLGSVSTYIVTHAPVTTVVIR